MSSAPIPIDVHGWVQAIQSGTQARRRREVTEIVLNAIATSSELSETCHLKGGILMGLLFGSPRLTADIDLTTTVPAGEDAVERFVEALDAGMTFTARELAYPDYVLRVHSVKRQPKHRFPDGASWPAIKLKINYADRRQLAQMRQFEAGGAVETLDIDISFNEPITHIEVLSLEGDNELLAYGQIELLAEKYRALIQQPLRNRSRRQDVYDIAYVLEISPPSPAALPVLRDAIIRKSVARNIVASEESLRNPEVAARAKAEWDTLNDELEHVPDFDERFTLIQTFYESLPWEEDVAKMGDEKYR